MEGGGFSESHMVPTCIALLDIPPIESIPDYDSKVVNLQNSPGGDEYCGRCTDTQPGSDK